MDGMHEIKHLEIEKDAILQRCVFPAQLKYSRYISHLGLSGLLHLHDTTVGRNMSLVRAASVYCQGCASQK